MPGIQRLVVPARPPLPPEEDPPPQPFLDLVKATEAPRVIELVGRDPARENAIMNGTYFFVCEHAGRPAYQKRDGSNHSIRYWPTMDRWLIDLDGLRDSDVCNGFAICKGGAEHPGDADVKWHIWETSRRKHVVDTSVRVLSVPLCGPACRKIIFLDVDGVLHAAHFAPRSFENDCMQHLARIVEETGAEIVLSSSWRLWANSRGRVIVDKALAKHRMDKVVGQTPDLEHLRRYGFGPWRAGEILEWVRVHCPGDVPVQWVAIDDLDMTEQLGSRMVLTDPAVGLTEDDVDEAVARLNRAFGEESVDSSSSGSSIYSE